MTDLPPLDVAVEDAPVNDRPDPGAAHQPPREDPITDQPPRHDPFAHGTGAPPPPSGGWVPPGGGFVPPPRPPKQAAQPSPRSKDARMRDKITQTYATVGLVVCAAAQTRATVIGNVDPIAPDLNKVRAHQAAERMNQAGSTTVQMAPAAADAWMEVAKEVPAVARALEQFMEGGAILGLVAVHVMMIIPYGVAAGWVPEAIGQNISTVGAAMGAAAGMDDD